MRSGKTTGGLIKITHNDAARAKWLPSAHILAQYTDSLQCLTRKGTGTWSEQHREMQISCTKKDKNDVIKFFKSFTCHNPFNVDEKNVLMNIVTGIIENKKINVDEAVQIGKKIHQDLDGTKFIDINFVKAKQVKTFMTMRKSVRAEKGDIFMSSNELFQRLILTVYISSPPEDSIFTYELETVAPAMLYDDGTMGKNTKSLLM